MQTLLLLSLVFAPLAFAAVEPWAYAPLQIFAFGAAAALFAGGRAVSPNPLYKNLLPAVLAIALLGLLQAVTESPVNAIVSVLMLREGWDVQNVTVVVGLRPYTSKANILPEQTIGRGLRCEFGADSARGTGAIVGDHGLTERITELLRNHARDEVGGGSQFPGAAAGRVRVELLKAASSY